MKSRFPGRLHTHQPRWSVSEGLTDKQAWALRGEVYRAGHTLTPRLLDCDAVTTTISPGSTHYSSTSK
ncbi:hypothetical protein GBAR_LOCUS8522 [Geodia barretti]|uniref:Uncharacterized protein n=1 Tax=Geodia barretti TaxID=519541 RepID=A0AA35WGG3_GEOBA|nr:hypothetical protein GBAR_LOCUS8522 [Geodia barretti]